MQLRALLLCISPALAYGAETNSKLISDTGLSFSTINRHNEALSPLLKTLCNTTDYFKYYKLNLFTKECPYFSEDGAFCGNRACAVDTIEEDEVPEVWRASMLGKLSGPSGTAASNLPLHTTLPEPSLSSEEEEDTRSATRLSNLDVDHPDPLSGETCVQDRPDPVDRNFCVPEDEDSDCVYVSLVDNEERYTGYHGAHAHAIWGSIYKENCFDSHGAENFVVESDHNGAGSLDAGYGEAGNRKRQFAQILRDPLKTGQDLQDTCVEKRIFYRLISGMHASISTHICASYLNQLSGRWEPNATCFNDRLRAHPDRISNIYFNYVLVSRAVAKIKPYLDNYVFCSGDPVYDVHTYKQVKQITSMASKIQYDESPLFEDRLLKEDFRNRFRNISMLMDCVGCDKCRLWGKVQTAGYGTALKILFDTPSIELRRGEIVALFNTYGRLSISLDALKLFNDATTIDDPIEVSDPSLTAEDVLSPSLENPQTEHASPKAPLEGLAETLTSIKESVVPPLKKCVPSSAQSFWASLAFELGEFGRAIKFLGQSYLNLPRRLWYTLFVAHKDSSFWDFVFAARQDEREL